MSLFVSTLRICVDLLAFESVVQEGDKYSLRESASMPAGADAR